MQIGMKKIKSKRIIAVIFMVLSFAGIMMGISSYSGGYDEVTAMVTKTYLRGKKILSYKEAYNLSWVAKDGSKVTVGNLANNKGYKAGDIITIKVDKETHSKMYRNVLVSSCIWVIILIVAIIFFVRYTKLIRQRTSYEDLKQ